jgi:hypothetical protein
MNSKRSVILGLTLAALIFSALRVYGAYRDEVKGALNRADAASDEAKRESGESDRLMARGKETTDLNYRLSLDVEALSHSGRVVDLVTYAAAERGYATDRKAQTQHILLKAWLFLTGGSETSQDWLAFLKARCDKDGRYKGSK